MAAETITGVAMSPPREWPDRSVAERLLAAAPWIPRLALWLSIRMPPRSGLKRRLLQRSLSQSFAVMNRGDLWFIPLTYEPDGAIRFLAADFRTLGLGESYRVDGGWAEATYAIREELPDARWIPEHLIDLGDRWVLRARISGAGRYSGIGTEQTWGCIYHLSARGRIARQDIYWTWDETLAAVGLEPAGPSA